MKVILKQDVKSLGKKDTIVNVSDGYAHNYLIPRGLAVAATDGNIKEVQTKQKVAEAKAAKELEEAKELAKKIEGKTFAIKTKVGENGKLFGAVSNKDIADSATKELGFEVDKKKIILDEPIKQLGTFSVEIKIYPGVSAKFNVKVEGI